MLSARPADLPLDADRGISTKTPGRVLSRTRNVLQENAARNHPMTVMGKGKKLVQNTPLQSKTLQTDRVLKDPPGKSVGSFKLKDTPAIRPLGDKTPFPNRTSNQLPASGTKLVKSALADGSLRPSSARKHDRLPRSASKAFETPVTNGKHWDVSDIEIEVDAPVANQSIEEQSHDEIEYMPPKVGDVPYEPPFEMPNYREVGKTLLALIRSYTLEDDPPSTNITFTADPSEHNFFAQPTLPQREIEDDGPFVRAKPEPERKPQPPTTAKQRSTVTGKPTPRPAAQGTTPATRTAATTTSRVLPAVRRPSTTSSVRPPITVSRTFSHPVTRAPTSRATTQTPSVVRSMSLVRTGAAQPSRAMSATRATSKPTARPTTATATSKDKSQPSVIPIATRNPGTLSNVPPNGERPRSGTITKAEFESNMHVVVHIRNNSLEDVKRDLEGLIVFEDAFDEDDGFRFDV